MHARQRSNGFASVRTLQEIVEDHDIRDAAAIHQEERNKLLSILGNLPPTDNCRARRVACSRILKAHDTFGRLVLSLVEDAWHRSARARRRERWFLVAVLAELMARGWIELPEQKRKRPPRDDSPGLL